ncbi:AAEL014512-PA, partial [Aedes aegypti]
RSGRKLDDVIDKYQKACRKLHLAHNEYVLLLSEAAEIEKDIRTILMPGLLEHQQSQQEAFILTWRNLLQDMSKLGDLTSDKYSEIQQRIETNISSISPAEEYREFTEKHKTTPTAPVVFQFDESLIEDSLGKLQANTLTVDNLTVDWLKSRQTELESSIKDLQEAQGKLCQEQNGGAFNGGTKPPTPILNGSNGTSVKDSSNKNSKELIALRCQERQMQKQVEMIRAALNDVGCEELPSGCDDLSTMEHLIENKKSVSQDLSVSRALPVVMLLNSLNSPENQSTSDELYTNDMNDSKNNLLQEDPYEVPKGMLNSSIDAHLDSIDELNSKLDQKLFSKATEQHDYCNIPSNAEESHQLTVAKIEKGPEKASFRDKIRRKIKIKSASTEQDRDQKLDDLDEPSNSFADRLRNKVSNLKKNDNDQFKLMKNETGSAETPKEGDNRKPKRKKKKRNKNRNQTFSEDELLGGEEMDESKLNESGRPNPPGEGEDKMTSFSSSVMSTFREIMHSTNKVKDSSLNMALRQHHHQTGSAVREDKMDLINNGKDTAGNRLTAIKFIFSDNRQQSDSAGSTPTTPEHLIVSSPDDETTESHYSLPSNNGGCHVASESTESPGTTNCSTKGAMEHSSTGIGGPAPSKLSSLLKHNLKNRFNKLHQKMPKLLLHSNSSSPLTVAPDDAKLCRACSRRFRQLHPSKTVLDFTKEFPNGGRFCRSHGGDYDGPDESDAEDGDDWGTSEMLNLDYEDIDECLKEFLGESMKPFDNLLENSLSFFNQELFMTLSTNRPLYEEEWFHGVLPREEVVRLLRNEGDFLVRETTRNDESQTVLSVCWNGHKHFIVQTTAEGHYRFEGPAFPSIQELILHQYQSELPVTGRSGAVLRKPVLRERWELSNDDVILLDKIGRGNFGDVYKAKLKSTKNTLVAVKTCRMTLPEEQKRKFLQEGRILKQYDHPNIVKLIGICVQKQPIMIVMELVSGGSLLMFLRKNAATMTQKQLMAMCRDAAAGMRYLESKNCIHRDLAARNCLIGNENIVKISDFGMSREEEEYIVSGGMKQIPIKWTAPEALNFGKYTSLCDVWSYGILVWEIFSRGDTPYSGLSNSRARERIDEGYRMPAPENTPPEMYRLMLKCWSYEPENRPHFDEIFTVVDALMLCAKD